MMINRNKFSLFLIFILFIFSIIYVLKQRYFPEQIELSCHLGEVKYYDISYTSNGTSDLSLFQSTKQAFKLELKGKVKETCLENNKDNLLFQFDFKNTNLLVKGHEFFQDSKENHLNSNMVLVDISNRGVINQIHFSRYIDPSLSNIYRDYIANSFINFTNKSSVKNLWENSFENYSGKNSFQYTIKNKKVERKFISTNSESTSYLYEDTRNINKIYSQDSITVFTLSSGNVPISISMKRYVQLLLNNKQIGSDETNFSKKLQQTENISISSETEKATFFQSPEFYKTDLIAKDVDQRLKEKMLLQNLKYSSFSDFLSNSNLEKKDSYTEYFLQLKSLFSLEPKSATDAIAFLSQKNKMGDDFSLILSALVNSGTIESQQSLIQTYYLLTDKKAKMVLLANLATIENPALETETFTRLFWNEKDTDLKNTAVLALGNIGKSLQEKEIQRKNKIYSDLISELQNSNSSHSKQVALLALGNLSDERALSAIYAALSSQNEEVRKSAAFALRFLKRSESDDYLKEVLLNDKSDSVRLSALEALSFRNSRADIIGAQKNILRNDLSEKVRMQALKNLAQAGEKEELKYAMKNDISKSIRTYAENLLTRFELNL